VLSSSLRTPAGCRPAGGPPCHRLAARLPGPLPLQAPLKSLAVRKWLAVNVHGEVRHLELAKLRVTAGLGVQLRDLRWVLPRPSGSSSCCQELVRLGCAAWLAARPRVHSRPGGEEGTAPHGPPASSACICI
jgi:hypothetical protein